jgi:hypothetical protein
MKTFKKVLIGIFLFFSIVTIFFSCDVIWKSPSFYNVKENKDLITPIMDMEAYNNISQTHRRPYCYPIQSKSKGKVYILGIEHVKDPNHPQLDTIRTLWNQAKPTVALVEGRLGFLFTWLQDPIKEYGEGGLVSEMAKKDGINLYTWEPTREAEIEILMKQFPVEQIAMFYSFRPYFSNMRHGKPENPEKQLQEYLTSRTDYDSLRDVFQSWEELDRAWQRDFPEINWRDYSDEQGWPSGYLFEIWNASNLSRDFHLIQTILELVEKGETVFVTMGASHAPRIEEALKSMIK